MGRYYILGDDGAVEEQGYAEWARWYKDCYEKVRCIASTKVKYGTVSTVFLAMNMTLSKSEPPMIFETRVHGGWLDNEWERFPTLEDAKAGHEAWVDRVRAEEDDKPPPPGWPAW
jgi:hypothetical protein